MHFQYECSYVWLLEWSFQSYHLRVVAVLTSCKRVLVIKWIFVVVGGLSSSVNSNLIYTNATNQWFYCVSDCECQSSKIDRCLLAGFWVVLPNRHTGLNHTRTGYKSLDQSRHLLATIIFFKYAHIELVWVELVKRFLNMT